MNKWLTKIIVVALMSVCSGWVIAGEHGWVTSIMQAYHSDQVYRVQIYKVDGKQFDAREYKLDVGEHTIGVTLVLETQWAPKLARIAGGATYEQAITFTVEDGVTYELGGKVDPDASDEAQRDGTFWKPIIYRQKK
jgi:hypothetical protein